MKRLSVKVNPEVIKWLREISGWKVEEVAKKLNVTSETVIKFETGEKSLNLRQLRILADSFKRPLAAFFLSKPKEQKPLPKDYRFLPNKTNVFDKSTILSIRKARYLQNLGKELSSNIKYGTEVKLRKADLSKDPDSVSAEYRELFNLNWEKQKKFKSSYELFNYLRDILEDKNILTFQFSMPIEDARGFALADEDPIVIVVNSKDVIEARIFTLLHELGHVVLGETAIDIPDVISKVNNDIEKWCNSFAASFLLPKADINNELKNRQIDFTDINVLNTLTKEYKVSKAAFLVRMLNLNYISQDKYEYIVNKYIPKEPKETTKKEKKAVKMASDKRCLLEMGNKFISLVANNYDNRFITYSDALGYLSIKSKNFERVLEKAKK